MKKFTGYSENIIVNGKTYTVSIIGSGKGLKTVYNAYITGEAGITKEMSGYPVDQRQCKIDPKVYTPEEVMEMAVYEAYDFINDIDRHEQFEDMLYGFLAEVDENREIAKKLSEQG